MVGTIMYRVRSGDMDGQYYYLKVVFVSEDNTAAGFQVLNSAVHEAIWLLASGAFKGRC